MLGDAVVVAHNRAGPEVRAGPEPRIADIGKMVGLGALLDHRCFDLDEISDVHIGAKLSAGPQPRERTDRGALADVRLDEVTERVDHGIVVDRDSGPEHDERLHHHVATEFGIGREKHRFGCDQGHARIHRGLAQPLLQHGFGLGQLGLGIDAAHVILLGLDHNRL